MVVVAAVAVFGIAPPVNAVLTLAALILGTAVFALLAAVSSAATRTVEMAQVTTLPVLVIAVAGWAARRWFRWEPRR